MRADKPGDEWRQNDPLENRHETDAEDRYQRRCFAVLPGVAHVDPAGEQQRLEEFPGEIEQEREERDRELPSRYEVVMPARGIGAS